LLEWAVKTIKVGGASMDNHNRIVRNKKGVELMLTTCLILLLLILNVNATKVMDLGSAVDPSYNNNNFLYITNKYASLVNVSANATFNLGTVEFYVTVVDAPTLAFHLGIFTKDGNKVDTQIGGWSEDLSVTATGYQNATWSLDLPNLVDGTEYWLMWRNSTAVTDYQSFRIGATAGTPTLYARISALDSEPVDYGEQTLNIKLWSGVGASVVSTATNYTTPVVSGSSNTIYFNITNKTLSQSNATLHYYNGSQYVMNLLSSNATSSSWYYTLNAPTLSSNANITFNFSYFASGVAGNSGNYNQSVIIPNITDCALTSGRVILNLSLKDEKLTSLVNLTSPNTANIELDLDITSKNNPLATWSFAKQWINNNTVAVCVPWGLLNSTSYKIDFTVGFDATDHVQEFYYLDNGTLDNTNYFNSYTDNTIDLFDLLTTDSTTFLFSYTDIYGLKVPYSIVHTYRKYIGEGLFREVERSKQDNNGQTHVHLVEEDVIYYFMVSQYGNILYTSPTVNAKCLSTPCEITLSGSSTDRNWSMFDSEGGKYYIYSNKATRMVYTLFNLEKSALVNMSLYKMVDGSEVLINQTSITAMAGTLNLHVPLVYGNNTFFVAVYRDNVFVKSAWIDMTESGKDYFGTFGAILSGMIILALMLMAVTEGAGFIVFTALALIIIGAMQLVSLSWLAIISIVCAGGVILFKLVSRRVING
jgi:hypothetical protein